MIVIEGILRPNTWRRRYPQLATAEHVIIQTDDQDMRTEGGRLHYNAMVEMVNLIANENHTIRVLEIDVSIPPACIRRIAEWIASNPVHLTEFEYITNYTADEHTQFISEHILPQNDPNGNPNLIVYQEVMEEIVEDLFSAFQHNTHITHVTVPFYSYEIGHFTHNRHITHLTLYQDMGHRYWCHYYTVSIADIIREMRSLQYIDFASIYIDEDDEEYNKEEILEVLGEIPNLEYSAPDSWDVDTNPSVLLS